MNNEEANTDLIEVEERLRKKYSKLSISFIIIGIILVSWILVVYSGSLFWNLGYNWAGLSLEQWIIVICVLIAALIILELVFYTHFSSIRDKRIINENKPEFIDDKKVIEFTYPDDVEGGIFSKTYIDIDKHNVLRMKILMVPPNELWGSK